MNEDNDYKIKIESQLNSFTYPVKNFQGAINSTSSTFMVGTDDFWHNGFHLYSTNEIRNICEGKVIAYRLTEDYKMYEIFKDVSMNKAVAGYYRIMDNWKFKDYFDIDDKNQYVIKSNLSKEEKEDLYKFFDRIYSNSFVLLEYTLKNLNDKEIKFYGLYNHLKPLKRLTVKQRMQLDWYKKTIKLNAYPKYFYIQAYKNISKDGLKDASTELEIPSETSYTELPLKYIEWTCNLTTYRGYLDNSYIVNWGAGKGEEIKSVNDESKSSNYLKSSDLNVKHDESRILIYDVKTRSNRNSIAEGYTDKDYKISMNIFEFQKYLEQNVKKTSDYVIEGFPIIFTGTATGYVFLTKAEITNIKKDVDNYIKEHKNYQETASFLMFNAKKGIKIKYSFIHNKEFSISKNTNYVKVIGVKKITGNTEVPYKDIDYIPCETQISLIKEQPYLYIEWTINNKSYKGYVERKDLRFPDGTYNFRETKRPNNVFEATNTKYFLPRNAKSKKDKLIIYTTDSKANRNVKGFTYEKEFVIDDFNNLLELFYSKGKERNVKDIYNKGIKVSYNDSKETGYIYFDWDYNVKNSDVTEEIEKNKETVSKNITDSKDTLKNWLITVADSGNKSFSSLFELKYKIAEDIVLDKIVTPNDLTFKRDKILGYAGYSFFKEQKEGQKDTKEIDNEDATSVHFETFTDNLDFMKYSADCKKYQCSLLVKKECVIQKGNLIPITHNKKITFEKNLEEKVKDSLSKQLLKAVFKPAFLPDELGEVIENCLFKKGKSVVVAGETFTELKPIARIKTLESSCYFLRSDLGDWLDNSYYGVKEDKTISAYDVNGNKQEDISIELFANYCYLWAETKSNLRRIKFIYEKINNVDSFFVSSKTLGKISYIKNNYYVCNIDDKRILAEEVLQEPKEQKWNDEQAKITEGVLEFKNIQCTDDNKIKWEKVKLQSGIECWIKQSDISEEDNTPIKKIIYDKWDKFFTQIDLKKYGKYYCKKKEDFLKEFGLELGKETKVSSVIRKNKELLYSRYYKRETEWLESDEYTNELIKHYPMNKDAIMQERTDYEFWSGLNGKLSKECYYFNPLGFLNHLDKVATPTEFNPYEKYGKEPTLFEMKSNPGFIPVGAFIFSQVFNKYHSKTYSHEGVDLAVDKSVCNEIPIESGINGKVIFEGDKGNYSYGCFIIIQATEKYKEMNKYYLLAHLSREKEHYHEGDTVLPGKIVGYVGNTGHCGTSLISAYDGDMKGPTNAEYRPDGYGAHLHLQLYLRKEDAVLFIQKMNLINLRNNDSGIQCAGTGIVNPFDYNEGYAKG